MGRTVQGSIKTRIALALFHERGIVMSNINLVIKQEIVKSVCMDYGSENWTKRKKEVWKSLNCLDLGDLLSKD